jgi:HSP90 family molecular chaperone
MKASSSRMQLLPAWNFQVKKSQQPLIHPALSGEDFEALAERFKSQLGERISAVKASQRLSDSVARLVDPEGVLNQEMQRVYRMMDRDFEVPAKILELNPRHPILSRLQELPAADELSL